MEKRNIPANIELRQVDDAVEFVVSTSSVDRHGTVINPNGWDLTNFRANPVMIYNHDSHSNDPDNVLGTWDVRVENGALIGRPNFESADINPKAEKVRRKIEAGTLRSVSVGFIPKEWHWGKRSAGESEDVLYFDRSELLEISVVAVPSNPSALKRSMEELRAEFTQEQQTDEAPETVAESAEDMGSVEIARSRSVFYHLKNA